MLSMIDKMQRKWYNKNTYKFSKKKRRNRMKITVLDKATLGSDIDLTPINEVGDTEVYDITPPEKIVERLINSDVCVMNKATTFSIPHLYSKSLLWYTKKRERLYAAK